jgi:hypothetical protein
MPTITRWRWRRSLLVAGLLLALTQAPVEAQASELAAPGSDAPTAESKPLPAGYREAFVAGVDEFERRNYEEARALLLEAHAKYPNARTLRSLGMVEFELRHYRQSLAYLDEALVHPERPLDAPMRTQVQNLHDRARRFVGAYHITLTPPDAQLRVDGVRHEVRHEVRHDVHHEGRPEDGVLVLDVGGHMLEASATGHATVTRRLSVAGGDERELRITLPRLTQAAEREPAQDAGWLRSPLLWVSVGVVVVAAAVGVAVASQDPGVSSPSGGNTNFVLTVPGS